MQNFCYQCFQAPMDCRCPEMHYESEPMREGSVMLLSECCDIERLRQIASHLYELIDAIDTAEDTARSDDKMFRHLVRNLYERKTFSGVHCPNGRDLHIDDSLISDTVKRVQTVQEQVLIGQLKMIAYGKKFDTLDEVTGFAARCLDAVLV